MTRLHTTCDLQLTFASTTFQRSPILTANGAQISFLSSMYSTARVSNLFGVQSSWFRRSTNRSCRLRQAFAVLLGKCLAAVDCQLRPAALAATRTSSSAELQLPVFLWPGWGSVDPDCRACATGKGDWRMFDNNRLVLGISKIGRLSDLM